MFSLLGSPEGSPTQALSDSVEFGAESSSLSGNAMSKPIIWFERPPVPGNEDAVAEAAAVALRDAEGSAEIIAAVLLQEGSDLDPAALRREIAAGLPAYAVPSSVYVRSDFPRTGSGKIDRQALVEEYKEDGNS